MNRVRRVASFRPSHYPRRNISSPRRRANANRGPNHKETRLLMANQNPMGDCILIALPMSVPRFTPSEVTT